MAVEQRTRRGGIEHRRLPVRHDVPWPAHRHGRVDWHHLVGDEPVEQVTDRGEPLLDPRRRELPCAGLEPGDDVHRLDGSERWHAGGRGNEAAAVLLNRDARASTHDYTLDGIGR